MIVEAEDQQRRNPRDVNRLYFKPSGAQNIIPNQTVTDSQPSVGRLSANHINQFPAVTLYFNLKPGVATGNATQFIQRTAAEVLPPTIRGQLQGEVQTFAQTFSQLGVLLFVAVFIMYIILGILYESWFHPITVLSSLPVASVGGLLTLLLFQSELSLYSYIGMFMLIGIVKKNGIMMVDFAVEQRRAGKTPVEAVHEASIERFRPIIMTTLAALMGAIPIALGFGADCIEETSRNDTCWRFDCFTTNHVVRDSGSLSLHGEYAGKLNQLYGKLFNSRKTRKQDLATAH